MSSRSDRWLERMLGAIPLLVVYFALAALYAWQASRRVTPTIFTDELELTQLSRAIAEGLSPARRGESYGLLTLAAYVLAPAWTLATTSAGFAAAKLTYVLAMTATVFPSYGIARLVVGKWYALAAAGGATAVPALAYAPILVEEPLAYPLATLALWLIARSLVTPGRMPVALAVAGCGAATLTRTQLSILFVVLALGHAWLAWKSSRMERWKATWTHWDWVGAATLGLGVLLGFSALMGHLSESWEITTRLWKGRILDYGTWAAGALAIGFGIFPLVAGLAALSRPKGERRDASTRAFLITTVAALVTFSWYAGVKGAYLSTVFASLVVERNLIYLTPLLYASAALGIARGFGRVWVIAAAAAVTFYVVAQTPLHLDQYPYYDAHGLSIGHFLNREWGWASDTIERWLPIAALVAAAVVLALRLIRRWQIAYWVVAGLAVVVVTAWSLTAEIYAAEGERIFSERFAANLATPYDWVDDATGGASVVAIGQQFTDSTDLWSTEFWNTAIRKVWSVDGTAPGPGPTLTPDLASRNGTLTPSPGTEYALAMNGVELAAPVVERKKLSTLYDIDGKPIRLASSVTGLYSDGWMSSEAAYNQFQVSGAGLGFARVKLSREAWCGKDVPGVATVKIGPLAIGPDKQPALGRITGKRRIVLHSCQSRTILLRPPPGPWRVEVTITPTFVPKELDPRLSDIRELGARFEAGFLGLD